MTQNEQTSPPADISDRFEWLTTRRFALFLALVVAAMFPGVVSGATALIFRDYGLYTYPVAFFHRETFWNFELPFWNPYSYCGVPFLAQWNTLALYPPALFYLLLPFTWALGVFGLAHLWWGGLGMFVFVRSITGNRLAAVVAGTAFALNGFAVNALMWAHYSAAISWFPWILLTADRAWRDRDRWALPVAAAVGTLQMLAGQPELVISTWLIVSAVWLGRLIDGGIDRRAFVLRHLALVATIALMAAPQLLPFFDLLQYSHRGQDYAGDRWALPGTGWANFLVPLFYTFKIGPGVYMQPGQGAITSYYAGIGVFAFAIVALIRGRSWSIWLTGIGVVLCLILSLGEAGHLLPTVKKVFPLLGIMRYPVKFMYPICFALPLLAGFGVHEAMRRDSGRCSPIRTLVLTTCALLAGVAFLLAFVAAYPFDQTPWKLVGWNGFVRALALILTTGGIVALAKSSVLRCRNVAVVVVVGATTVDLITHTPLLHPTVPAKLYEPGMPAHEKLQPPPTPSRGRAIPTKPAVLYFEAKLFEGQVDDFVARRVTMFPNANIIDGMAVTTGFASLQLKHERQIRRALYGANLDHIPDGLADFLSARYISAEDDIFEWTPRPTAQPIVSGGARPVFAPEEKIVERLLQPGFDPRKSVLMTPETKAQLNLTDHGDVAVSNVEISNQRTAFDTQSESGGIVTVSHAHYHRWKVAIDGEPAELLRVNHAFQAVEVPAGSRTVEIQYRDNAFRLGVALCLIGMVGSWGWAWRRKRTP